MAKKKVKRKAKRKPAKKAKTVGVKLKIGLRNLILFAVLSLIFYWLASILSLGFWGTLFWALSVLAGVIALAFLIITLVFLFMKWMRK